MSHVAIPSSVINKRARTPSQSSASSTQSVHKAARLAPGASLSSITSNSSDSRTVVPGDSAKPIPNHPLICNLPPTCDRKPTPIADSNELERHYATHHAFVCEVKGCRCVFPEARFLDLHQTECHDPIAAIRKERGDKIFRCHISVPECGRYFLTPKARRLHMIQTHSYPKEYFFAITNKGVGELLKKWGDGASLIRKQWRPRESKQSANPNVMKEDDSDSDDEEEEKEDQGMEGVALEEENFPADIEATPRMMPRNTIHSPQSSSSSKTEIHPGNQVHRPRNRGKNKLRAPLNTQDSKDNDESGLAGLTSSLNALSLVPSSIRFGRGGKAGAFIPRGQNNPRGQAPRRGGGSNNQSHSRNTSDVMDVDVQLLQGGSGRGSTSLGAAGRGRAGISNISKVSRGRGRGRGDSTGSVEQVRGGLAQRGRGNGKKKVETLQVLS